MSTKNSNRLQVGLSILGWLLVMALICIFSSCSTTRKPHKDKDQLLYKDSKYIHMMKWDTFEEYVIIRKY
jgi:hypothetical protein